MPTATAGTTPSVVQVARLRRSMGSDKCTVIPIMLRYGRRWGAPIRWETGFDSAAEQNFEHGYMFWNGDDKRIYVFSAVTNTWRSYTDTWVEGEPPPVALTPPAGYFQPVRGFGKIWVDYPEIRQALGWATGQEHGITAAWQSFTHGAMLWTNRWMDGVPSPAGALRIGLAHGSVQGFGSAGEANVPIDPARVKSAGLSYLALGDWHGTTRISDRAWYSGTPEPDGFRDNDPGNALIVRVDDAAAPNGRTRDDGTFHVAAPRAEGRQRSVAGSPSKQRSRGLAAARRARC